MSARFEELDWRETAIGAISLRRRRDPRTGIDIYEVKLDDDFLMSSLFTVAEVELARLALGTLSGPGLDVVVGGLGLGYTANEVLANQDVASLVVIDAVAEVIEWHERGLVPLGPLLTADPRCRLVHGDFFALASSVRGLDPDGERRRFDAIIVDIDHAPDHLLHPSHGDFYTPSGTRATRRWLRPAGVFALWSNDPPDDSYIAVLEAEYDDVAAHVVSFPNPLQDREATNTVYVASSPRTT